MALPECYYKLNMLMVVSAMLLLLHMAAPPVVCIPIVTTDSGLASEGEVTGSYNPEENTTSSETVIDTKPHDAARPSPDCKHSKNTEEAHDELAELHKSTGINGRFILIPGENGKLRQPYVMAEFLETAASVLGPVGSQECNSGRVNVTSPWLRDRSICPWDIDFHVDCNRIPMEILVAECRCKNMPCHQAGDNQPKATCQKVTAPMPVLYKHHSEGELVFKPGYFDVTVACVCSYAQVLYQTE